MVVGSSSRNRSGCDTSARARTRGAAARQRVDDGIRGEVEPGEHELDTLLEPPAVAVLELMLQAPEPLERTSPPSAARLAAAW